ncbi:Adenylate cyclase (EC / Guanylate cyclase (EC [Olavius algarvensis Delta 1 endosymbiont]|nr:Adenylate cyclase (EC / Guanylate cyclase (EC [Olavius algarvensis Delta 1 endosymbiont]
MKCPECQYDNRERAKFCNECGYKFFQACPECGATNRVESKFCDECGYDLRKSNEAPPVNYDLPQSYTPKFLADKILTNRSYIEGEGKLVTVLFADVANYTEMSEKLDPEEVHQIMNGCFNILVNEIHRYEGTINQFTGDGIMALFGAPVAHEDHAQRACYAALSVQKSILEYGDKIGKDLGIDFKMRIGINSGPVVVGAIGDDLRMDYTAMGDTTNLASRLENSATPGSIMVSKNTYKLAREFFEFKLLDRLRLKGKEKPQQAYELVKTSVITTRIEASAAKGFTKFVGRKNSMAALNEALNKVTLGSGQVVGVVGEAGVGKSRLIFELRRSVQKVKCYFLEGKCLHYGSTFAYLPVLDILKSYFDIKEGDPETLIKQKMNDKILQLDGNLQNSLFPFQQLLSLKVEDESFNQLEPQKKKERIFEAFRDLFVRESQKQPLILVVEDLHWIDRTSEQLIDYFIGWLANSAILLILLYRPEYTPQWGSKSYYNKIGLGHLTHKSGTELIKEWTHKRKNSHYISMIR